MERIDLFSTIEKVRSGTQSSNELNHLIKQAYQVANTILKTKFASKLNFNVWELTTEDIAMDSIVQLFTKNKENQLGIKRALDLWNDQITNEADANYFFYKIIWRRVEQTVTKLLKQRDPVFEKIHKTLSVCIASSPYKKLNHFGTVYIVRESTEKISGKLLDDNALNSFPAAFFELKQIELLNTLFAYTEKETDFYPAIPLNDLIKRIKHHYFIKFKNHKTFVVDKDHSIYLEDTLNNSLKSISTKLDTFYVSKNKLTEAEAEMLMASFNDISLDIMNGGLNSSLYSYLKYQKDSLTQDEFYKKYHHIMNYLFNDLKKNISELF